MAGVFSFTSVYYPLMTNQLRAVLSFVCPIAADDVTYISNHFRSLPSLLVTAMRWYRGTCGLANNETLLQPE
ncbi:MAG: hypothetical protein ACI9FJ_002086 [Alteromonadaceae bacterium]|jgi:hypothetical protein